MPPLSAPIGAPFGARVPLDLGPGDTPRIYDAALDATVWQRSIIIKAPRSRPRSGRVIAQPVQALAAQDIFNATVNRRPSLVVLAPRRVQLRPRGRVVTIPVQALAAQAIFNASVTRMASIVVLAKVGVRRRVGRTLTIPVQNLAAQAIFNATVTPLKPFLIIAKRAYRRPVKAVQQPTIGILGQTTTTTIVAYTRALVVRAQQRRGNSGAVGTTQSSGPGSTFDVRRMVSIVVQALRKPQARPRGRVTILPSSPQLQQSFGPLVVAYMRSIIVQAKVGTRRRVGRTITIPVQFMAAQDAFNQTVIRMASIIVKATYAGRRRISHIIISPTTGQLQQSFVVAVITYLKPILVSAQVGANRSRRRGSWHYTARSSDDLVFQEDTRPPIQIVLAKVGVRRRVGRIVVNRNQQQAALGPVIMRTASIVVQAMRPRRLRPAGRVIQNSLRSALESIYAYVALGGGGLGTFFRDDGLPRRLERTIERTIENRFMWRDGKPKRGRRKRR